MKKWLIFTAIATMLMLINVDGTFMSIALASISHYFNLSLEQVKWVQSSYYITTAVSILIFGHLSDKYGAKKIYMIGVLFFGLGSTIAGLCPHFSELITGRVIQGLGFGATIGVGYIIIHQSFPLQLRGLALGISYTISGLSLAAGPIIAGILVQHYSWRLVLLVNTPFCLFSLYMLWKYATNYAPNKSKSLTLTSTLLFIIGSTLLMLILSQCSHLDLNTTLLGLATSLVLLILFISASKHNPNHLLNYSLLQDRCLHSIILTRFIYGCFWSMSAFIIPLYLQNILNFSVFNSGLILAMMSLLTALSSPFTGKFIDQSGYVKPIKISIFLSLVSSLFFCLLEPQLSWSVLLIGLCLQGIGWGMYLPSITYAVSARTPPQQNSSAMGLLQFVALTGAAMGVAIGANIFSVAGEYYLNAKLPNATVSIYHVVTGTKALNSIHSTKIRAIVAHGFVNSLHYSMWILAALLAIGMAASFRVQHKATH